MGRQPRDRTLPTYVGSDPKTGYLRYFRRPPVGVKVSAFVRSFGTSNKTEMRARYAAIHAEADRLFTVARTGREKSDDELRNLALLCVTTFTVFDDQMDGDKPSLMDRAQIERRLFSTIESNEPIGLVDPELWSKGRLAIKRIERVQLNEPDRAQLLSIFMDEYHRERITKTRQVRTNTVHLEQQLRGH